MVLRCSFQETSTDGASTSMTLWTPLQSEGDPLVGRGSWRLRLVKEAQAKTWNEGKTSTSSWRRQWHPLQYSCLENPMDGGAWWAADHGVAKGRVQLRNFTFTFHCHALEKEMVTHSSVLAWRIPGTEEPGGLPSMGSHRVGHD